MATVLFGAHDGEADVEVRGDSPWIPTAALASVTGWHLEDRGVCRGEQCIPVPAGARWSDGERFDLGAFAAHRGQGVARTPDGDVWSFGPPSGSAFETAQAPDFALPDFAGREHRLSDYRGRKVVIMTWASW